MINCYVKKKHFICTLFTKRKLHLISPFALVPLGHWPWLMVLMILSNGLGSNMQKTPSRNFSRFSHNFKMFSVLVILCRSRNSSNLIAINTNPVPFSNIVFLLGMNVCQGNLGWYFIFVTFQLTDCKRPHLKISKNVKMIMRFQRPCQGELAGGTQVLVFL